MEQEQIEELLAEAQRLTHSPRSPQGLGGGTSSTTECSATEPMSQNEQVAAAGTLFIAHKVGTARGIWHAVGKAGRPGQHGVRARASR